MDRVIRNSGPSGGTTGRRFQTRAVDGDHAVLRLGGDIGGLVGPAQLRPRGRGGVVVRHFLQQGSAELGRGLFWQPADFTAVALDDESAETAFEIDRGGPGDFAAGRHAEMGGRQRWRQIGDGAGGDVVLPRAGDGGVREPVGHEWLAGECGRGFGLVALQRGEPRGGGVHCAQWSGGAGDPGQTLREARVEERNREVT